MSKCDYTELFDKYVQDDLSTEEKLKLTELLKGDIGIKRDFFDYITFSSMIAHVTSRTEEKEKVMELNGARTSLSSRRIMMQSKQKKPLQTVFRIAIAACLAVITGIFLFILSDPSRPGNNNIKQPGPVSGHVQGRIMNVSQNVTIRRTFKTIPAKAGMEIWEDDNIRTQEAQRATIAYRGENTQVIISEKADVTFQDSNGAKQVDVEKGRVRCRVSPQPPGKPFVVTTDFADAVVMGTVFSITVYRDHTRLEVEQGVVRFVRKDGESVDVKRGYYSRAGRGIELVSKKIGDEPLGNRNRDTQKDNFLVVDLVTKTVSKSKQLSDLTTNDDYKTTKIVLKRISEGFFEMGGDKKRDEKPKHSVYVPGCYMGIFEITQRQWFEVMDTWPSGFKSEPDKRPVENVSWNDCKIFLEKLNNILGRVHRFRLPTEAEWEYACRAGTDTRFSYGDTADGSYMWYNENSDTGNGPETHEVGTKLPNPWGLYDMHGNVWEWCEDDYHYNYNSAPVNGSAWIDNPRKDPRVIRGGFWNNDVSYVRSAIRNRTIHSNKSQGCGFRISRDLR